MFKNIKTAGQLAAEEFESAKSSLMSTVQQHMDSVAKQRNYDNILSLCTYATSLNPVFSAEGQAGVEWRDAVWSYCYAELDKVIAGTRARPTPDDLIDELPAFVWPVTE